MILDLGYLVMAPVIPGAFLFAVSYDGNYRRNIFVPIKIESI